MNRRQYRFVVAGTHSGVGKTTVALGLMAALRRRGLCVQPFKVGPDFIDPGHHTAICGRPCRNLDTWMLPPETVRRLFERQAASADVAVVEGVMGLFDGAGLDSPHGSTAEVAQLIGAPVVLVVDGSAVARSIAAVVKGFSLFDETLSLVGVICNRVAGPKHYAHLEAAIRRHTAVVPLGWLPRRPEWVIPERHLGLTTVDDLADCEERARQLAEACETTLAIDRLLDLTATGPMVEAEAAPPAAVGRRRRVAVARDAAFCFYYPDNLEWLEAAGGHIVPFSPLADSTLPTGIDAVYLGGGYPELHARHLAANEAMRVSLRRYHADGGTIYAECGGLMYLCREIVTTAGEAFPMVDLLPARAVMQGRLAALGYVAWHAVADTPLGPAGTLLRGHEYHYSRLEPLIPLPARAELRRQDEPPRADGFGEGRLLAGYAHLHFGSNPAVAWSLLGEKPPAGTG